MHEHAKTSAPSHPHPPIGTYTCTEGEFAGWKGFKDHGFEDQVGPFWYREEPDGSMRCAFRVEKKHVSDSGNVHGGCFMAFADFCLFVIAKPVKQGPGVTVSMACDFIDAARQGDLVVGTGTVTRAGGSLIFVRGQFTAENRTLFTFSGTIKRLKQKPPAHITA